MQAVLIQQNRHHPVVPIGNRFRERVLYTRCLLLEVRHTGNQHLSERQSGHIILQAEKQKEIIP